MRVSSRFGLTAAVVLALASSGLATTLLDEKYPRRDRLEVVGFELLKPGEIEISAAGLGFSGSDEMSAYAWIIDHDSRHLVWEMKEEDTEKAWGKKYVRKVTADKVFARGKYELYLFTGNGSPNNIYVVNGKNDLSVLERLFSGSSRDIEDYLDDCFFKLSSSELTEADIKKFEPTGDLPGALLAENRMENNEFVEKAFKLDKPENLRIYGFMEQLTGSDPVDFGWITNADTREKVWSGMDERSVRGGGNKKNRKIDVEITLPAGNYILTYVTDDSHSYRRFNAAPPYDPMNWGITLLPGKDFQPAAFHVSEMPVDPKPLLDMTEVGDDEDISAAFSLARQGTIRVHAEGEENLIGDEFADYGWIEDASGKTVWEMTHRNTEWAGGAEKNRIFDGEITLPSGKYTAHFISDGSHSYPDWNSESPWKQRAWGLAIFPGKGFSSGDFKVVTEPGQRHRSSRRLRGDLDLNIDHIQRTIEASCEGSAREYALSEVRAALAKARKEIARAKIETETAAKQNEQVRRELRKALGGEN